MTQKQVLNEIEKERYRQDIKWRAGSNDWPSDPRSKYLVLAEEVGEVATALLEADAENLREELIQVAAVAVAWLENIHNDEVNRYPGVG